MHVGGVIMVSAWAIIFMVFSLLLSLGLTFGLFLGFLPVYLGATISPGAPWLFALLAAGSQPAVMDNEGNSALLYAMNEMETIYYSSVYVNFMESLQNMMLEYTSEDEIQAARAVMKEQRKNEIRKNASEKSQSILVFLVISLLVGGLSIGIREGVYRSNKSKNWMGVVNGILTMGALGVILGFYIGANSYNGPTGSWSNMFGPAVQGAFVSFVSLIGGCIIACLAPVRKAFTEIPELYYLPAAGSIITLGVLIIRIWL